VLIASGRDLGDFKSKKGKYWRDNHDYTALEIARNQKNLEVATVLQRFIDNPVQTRHELRVKHGVLDELAAEVFALTVFLCDDLLHLKPAIKDDTSNPPPRCCSYSIFRHCQMSAHRAADDALPFCCWLWEAEYSQGFRGCLHITRQGSSCFPTRIDLMSNQMRSGNLPCSEERKKKKKKRKKRKENEVLSSFISLSTRSRSHDTVH